MFIRHLKMLEGSCINLGLSSEEVKLDISIKDISIWKLYKLMRKFKVTRREPNIKHEAVTLFCRPKAMVPCTPVDTEYRPIQDWELSSKSETQEDLALGKFS